MKGVWWLGDKNDLSFNEDLTEPKVTSVNDVKIKVAYSGICGSDFHYMRGEMGKFNAKQDGVVLGHEFSGTVVDVGEQAKKMFKMGDRVCVNPNGCCGKCTWSTRGKAHFCESNSAVGVKSDGGWAEYCVVPASKVYKLPDDVTLMQGALGEPYSCVLRGWQRIGELEDKTVPILIEGAGIIGLLFCTLFHKAGCKNVTVCEPNSGRRAMCSGMGLKYDVVDPQEIELSLKGKDIDQCGYDLVVDCTGNPAAFAKGIKLARRGATVCVFGCAPAGKAASIEPHDLFWKELRVIGSFISNPPCFSETMTLLHELAGAGYLDYDKLGVKQFELDQYEAALESLRRGESSKAMFRVAA